MSNKGKEYLLVGKTIESVDFTCVNTAEIHFTDGSIILIEGINVGPGLLEFAQIKSGRQKIVCYEEEKMTTDLDRFIEIMSDFSFIYSVEQNVWFHKFTTVEVPAFRVRLGFHPISGDITTINKLEEE
mgnify:CR=1 FL=1